MNELEQLGMPSEKDLGEGVDKVRVPPIEAVFDLVQRPDW
jgi:hypothetical protein